MSGGLAFHEIFTLSVYHKSRLIRGEAGPVSVVEKSERENKGAAGNLDGADGTVVESNIAEASRKMFTDSQEAVNHNSNANGSDTTFERSKSSSASMAETGVLPALKISEEPEQKVCDLPMKADLEAMKQSMIDAKGKTNGWDKDPPTHEELKHMIGNSDVVFWGDDHQDQNSLQIIEKALEPLKKAGVDTIALEGLREDQQNTVNDWLAAGKGSPEEANLEEQIRSYFEKSLNDPELAKNAGMKILCIEPPGGRITYSGDGKDLDRDYNWDKVVQNHLKENPDHKILMFAGSTHFTHFRGKTVAARMANNGTKTVDLTPPSQYLDKDIDMPTCD
jgi:hypothetical protein